MFLICRLLRLKMCIIVLGPGLNECSDLGDTVFYKDRIEGLVGGEFKPEISFISKPHSGVVDVACFASIQLMDLNILCPDLDGLDDTDLSDNGIFRVDNRLKYQRVERTVSWKSALLHKTFSCFCQGRLQSAIVRSNDVHIDCSKLKEIKTKYIKRNVNANEVLRLRCGIDGFPRVQVVWYKDHQKLEMLDASISYDGVEYHTHGYGNRLIFNTSSLSASAYYTCQASNMAGKEWGQHYNVSLFETMPIVDSITRKCNHGYSVVGHNCIDVDECLSNPCKPNATCINTLGSFDCYDRGELVASTLLFTTGPTNFGMPVRSSGNYMIGILIAVLVLYALATSLLTRQTRECTRKDRIKLPSIGSPDFDKYDEYEYSIVPVCRSINYRELPAKKSLCDAVAIPAGPSKIPQMANSRYFATEMIDHRGGEITLHDTGIKLVVLPGALRRGTVEAIYVTLMRHKQSSLPCLERNQSLVSPLILCGPPGLKFEKPALLFFPHCASTRNKDSQFKILYSETQEHKPMQWTQLMEEGQTSNDQFFFTKDQTGCCLYVPHFTGFGAASKDDKPLAMSVYRQNRVRREEDFRLRVHFTPAFQTSKKEVKKQEKELGGKLCDAERCLMFKNNGEDLLVSIERISEGWERVLDDAKQEVDFSEISQFTMGSPAPCRTFTLRHVNVQERNVRCIISARQGADGKPVKISVSALVDDDTPPASASGFRRRDSGFVSSTQSLGNRSIPPALKRDLILLLDKDDALFSNNWAVVAVKIGMSNDEISYLKKNPKIVNPSEIVLERWEKQPDDGPVSGLEHLASILAKIGRHDAVEKIQRHYTLETVRQPSTTSVEEIVSRVATV